MNYQVVILPIAQQQITGIKDRRIQAKLLEVLEKLRDNPAQQGKRLSKELTGYYSMRAVGQRYRIIYSVNDEIVTVGVATVGIRKDGDKQDAYELAKKLVARGLI